MQAWRKRSLGGVATTLGWILGLLQAVRKGADTAAAAAVRKN
jgi:hypothetical protein